MRNIIYYVKQGQNKPDLNRSNLNQPISTYVDARFLHSTYCSGEEAISVVDKMLTFALSEVTQDVVNFLLNLLFVINFCILLKGTET